MRRWQKIALGVSLSVVGAMGILVGALQLPVVQQRIVGEALRIAAKQTDMHMRLEGTHGFFPWTLNVDLVEVESGGEKLFEAKRLQVQWSPLSLLRKRIVIDDVSVDAVSFWAPPSRVDQEAKAFSFPDLNSLPNVRVAGLRVDEVAFYAVGAKSPERFSLTGQFGLGPEGQVLRLDLVDLGASSERVLLTLDHHVIADTLELSADVAVTDRGLFAPLLQTLDVAEGRLNLKGSGPASNWQGQATFALGTRLSGDLSLACACNRNWTLALKGLLAGDELAFLDEAVGNAAPLEVQLVLAGQGFAPQVALKDVALIKGDLAAHGQAQLDLAPEDGAALTFDIEASIDEIAREDLKVYLPLRLAAQGSIGADGHVRVPSLSAETDFAKVDVADLSGQGLIYNGLVRARVQANEVPWPGVQDRALGLVTLTSAVEMTKDRVIFLHDGQMTAEGPALQAVFEADIDVNAQAVHLESTAYVDRAFAVWGREVDIKDAVHIVASAEGFSAEGMAALTAQLPSASLQGQRVPPLLLEARLEGVDAPRVARMALTSEGSTPWLSELDAALHWEQGLQAACQGALKLKVQGQAASGDVQGCLTSDNPFSGGTLALQATSLRWLDHTAGDLSANLEWTAHQSDQMVASASGRAKDLNLGGVLVPEATVSLHAAVVGDRLEARFDTGEVVLREATFRLARPADLVWRDGALDMKAFSVETQSEVFGAGTLKITDLHMDEAIFVTAVFDNVPLVALPAKASGEAHLAVQSDASEGATHLTITSRVEGSAPAEIVLASEWRTGMLNGSADISFGGKSAESMRIATWRVPLQVTRQSNRWAAQVGAATAEFYYDGPIDPVVALLPIYAHEVTGHLRLDGDLKVGAEGPVWQGSARLSEASYAYARGGVALDHITATATGSGRGMKMEGGVELIQEIPSSNGNGDKATSLKGEGSITFNSFDDWQTHIQLALNNSPLLHHAYTQGRASGDLVLTANPETADLTGHIVFDELNIQIPPPGPAEIIPLKIVPVAEDGSPLVLSEPRNSTTWLPGLHLDVTLAAENRLFLTGRGINTEWQAKGVLKGPASAAAVSGSMQALRGSIEFGGRVFEVERGTFDLVKGDVDGAQIDLQAKYAAPGGTLARIVVAGTVGTPKISFASTPPLPEEEIVAFVLFGKPLAELGPIEVLRTGTAVAQISGRTGGYDGGLMTRMRRSLGIDYLSIDPTGGGDSETPVVTAGKYIGKGVFLKVIQGLGELTGALSVEYAVTDEITLSTEVDETFQSEAAVEWKRDY